MSHFASIRSAVIQIITPLVRILLRNGISYGTFSDIAKEVYVRVAMQDFAIEGRKQTISRVSVLTGLNRKAVKTILEQPEEKSIDSDEAYNRAARVIAGWRRDTEFQSDHGAPADLPFAGEEGSFAALAKKYSGDIPARAVLDEMIRVEAAEKMENGNIRLLVRAYLPTNDTSMKLHILGTDVARLIATIGHNLESPRSNVFLQRTVAYDNLPKEALEPFLRLATNKSQALLELLDQQLSEKDRDNHPEIEGTGRYAAGVGIYFFQEPMNHES